MTREEAIKILEYPVLKWSMEWDEREDGLSYYEAIDMAISALCAQQEHTCPCDLCDFGPPSSDSFTKRVKSDDFCSYGERKEGADNG